MAVRCAYFLYENRKTSQGVFLLLSPLRANFSLAKRFKIVFEQAAYAPQFSDHHGVRQGDKRPAPENTPPHVFGYGQPGNARLFHKAGILVIREAECPSMLPLFRA